MLFTRFSQQHGQRLIAGLLMTCLSATGLLAGCPPIIPGLCSVSRPVGSDPANPLVGIWQATAALSCQTSQNVEEVLFNELIFRADGSFALTWFPFECYVDYWGTYTYDPATGALAMAITGGNARMDVLDRLDLEGSVDVQAGGSILLSDVYFGGGGGSDPDDFERTCAYTIE